MKPKFYILPVIIVAQFLCTSLWFAGNAVIDDFAAQFDVSFNLFGYLLSLVQLGFIAGTLSFAVFTIADRYKPSKVFFISAVLGALCNLTLIAPDVPLITILSARFGTGFFLAGIYPIGMKIASDYYKDGLGKALGYLVGALVLGTALPHLLKEFSWNSDYKTVIITISILSGFGGLLIFSLVPDGPYRRPVTRFKYSGIIELFGNSGFKRAAFGYFGHMWELYAFWGFIPLFLKNYNLTNRTSIPISLWSFLIIAIGFFSCIVGGYLAIRIGSKKVAQFSLLFSGILCLLSPLLYYLPSDIFLGILCVWGMIVISDSPQFSTIVAATSEPRLRGTGLTIVNCIGFAITIVSIQLLSGLSKQITSQFLFTPLAIGPLFGLLALQRRN